MNIEGLDPAEIKLALSKLNTLPRGEQIEFLETLEAYEKQAQLTARQTNFLPFIKHVYPGYKVGPHHRRLSQIFEDIANGVKKRVIVNIAPSHRN